MSRLIAFVLAVALLAACDDKSPDRPAEEKSSAQTSTTEKEGDADAPFGIGKIRVIGSQGVYKLGDDVPEPADVREKLVAAIEDQPLFASSGEQTVDGQFTYDVRKAEDGAWDMMIVGSVRTDNARFDGGINYKSSDERWKGKSLQQMVDAGATSVAEKLDAQAHVLGSDTDEIIAILQDADEPEEAHLLAIQEVRERSARNATEQVKPFLNDPKHSSKLRVAAAATLVGLGDETVRADVLKLAEQLSRDRDPQYVPVLHILADLGGPEVITYLEAVAEGHSAPAVRAVASEALEAARGEKETP